MRIKKLLSIAVATSLVASAFVGCGSSNSTNGEANSDSTSKSTQEIYFLNFKPEIADVYKKIAKDYEAETGVKVKVETAASGTYEQTLKSEIAKKDAPTIFQINGPVGYQSWKDYCSMNCRPFPMQFCNLFALRLPNRIRRKRASYWNTDYAQALPCFRQAVPCPSH